jgi:hypothetical protein
MCRAVIRQARRGTQESSRPRLISSLNLLPVFWAITVYRRKGLFRRVLGVEKRLLGPFRAVYDRDAPREAPFV